MHRCTPFDQKLKEMPAHPFNRDDASAFEPRRTYLRDCLPLVRWRNARGWGLL